jgi:HlyD family secretion protein
MSKHFRRANYFILSILSISLLCSCRQSIHETQGYVEGQLIYIASPFSGQLITLKFNKGESVKSGDLLFTLDKEPQLSQLNSIRANLAAQISLLKDMEKPRREPELDAIKAQIQQSDANLQLAIVRANRMKTLFDKHVTDKDSLDASIAQEKEARQLKEKYESDLQLALLGSRDEQIKAKANEVESIKAQVNQYEWQLKQKQQVAPVDAVIYDDYYRQGEFVSANQPVLSLLTPNNIHIVFYLPLVDAEKINVGQLISFSAETGGQFSQGKISFVSPEAEFMPPLVYSRENSDKLVFRVEATLNDIGHFKPGQPVIVQYEI